jgi:LysR family transcriptional regulator, glycine cleavage system transcriptional activator
MYGDLPPLTWLRAFEVSARLLSFTAAAHELHLTQAAVSKHVKSLEQRLRHQLFIRHPRSLELTKWGEAYLPKVQDALERLAIGTREVFGRAQDDVLTIRCAVSFAVNWLSPRLPRFLDQHPSVRMRILSSVWADPFDAEAYDLDIQYGTGSFPDAVSHRLTREVITPLCAPGLVPSLESPADLADHLLLHVQGYQEGWGTWLSAAGAMLVDPGQGIQTDTSLTAYALACEGAGVALGRQSLEAPYRTNGRLVAPFELEVPISEGFFLLEPIKADAQNKIGPFVDWLLSEAATAD